ncbi:hypothetical protein CROQUDRAFT_94214 [Cronartium quercuum f. sp. fusiforme G11]|uniref:Uncharacterized protein n=1 Tax=Cronartium quercuum f. sp. fusiforme G11 TaxID=708437 RepID=A0A9P6NJD8_9BASI|nr:hypothetical protein CROQUDRAFT_94214 [Cronartium quercuum f. sp. fusiforme G11]
MSVRTRGGRILEVSISKPLASAQKPLVVLTSSSGCAQVWKTQFCLHLKPF